MRLCCEQPALTAIWPVDCLVNLRALVYVRREQDEAVHAFLAATAAGYQYAAQHPEDAASLLCKTVTEEDLDAELVKDSMQMLAPVCC